MTGREREEWTSLQKLSIVPTSEAKAEKGQRTGKTWNGGLPSKPGTKRRQDCGEEHDYWAVSKPKR